MFTLEGDQIDIGRDSTNEVVINDAEISRRHARLTFQGGKYVLEDLGSTNGTFVNGQRLAGPRVLKPGEVVSFGEQIVMVFEATNFDAGATVVSPRAAVVPSISRPAPIPPLLLLITWEVCQPARRQSRLVLPSEGLHLCSLLLAWVFFSSCVCVSLSSGGSMRISCGARSSHSWVVVNKNQQHPASAMRSRVFI